MEENGLRLREVRPEDAGRLAEIYGWYVRETAVSFEYEAPSAAEFEERIRKITAGYPYLVCLKGDTIIGYAYADAFGTRKAYDWTAVASIYIDRAFRRQKAGALLYEALEARLRDRGIVNLMAAVACGSEGDKYITRDSCRFHLRMGYREDARMERIGKKFGRWYDILWMRKLLAPSEPDRVPENG